ncbi:MAG: tRNA 2-thiouridine(34) synthase MnmA [bacterium]|nr:tRNA 2-thiouridine(34) synthase MnmA [bacterium]
MSGGVDSSVAAALLVERGYDVVGLFMRVGVEAPAADEACSSEDDTPCNPPGGTDPAGAGVSTRRLKQGCCGSSDAADARFVAGQLGVPFYALNFKADFDALIEHFADEYARGRTPNPCIMCNDRLKFGKLVDYADRVGAEFVATGHYARIAERDGRPALLTAVDSRKDQSYVLFGIDRAVLARVLFPLGEMTKDDVRGEAVRRGLPVHDKPDSVEICFVPDQDYARVVRERRPEAFQSGDVFDSAGNLLGRHEGIPHYTIGQRRGLGIATGQPIYVTGLDPESNTVTVGSRDALLHRTLIAERVKLLVDRPGDAFRAVAKIRYQHRAAAATVFLLDGGRMRVEFDEPQTAITPGQACVIYDGEVVFGGGWIVGPVRNGASGSGGVNPPAAPGG